MALFPTGTFSYKLYEKVPYDFYSYSNCLQFLNFLISSDSSEKFPKKLWDSKTLFLPKDFKVMSEIKCILNFFF